MIFLLSGGASALFELSDLDLNELQSINDQMLKKGLNIEEINTIRKRQTESLLLHRNGWRRTKIVDSYHHPL